MAPPASVFIERDGVRLHALDHGGTGKPVLLLLHGAAAHAHWWDRTAPAFGEYFRPLAVDLRGHGDSEWAKDYSYRAFTSDLAAWVDWARREGEGPPAVIAHSLGGVVALKLHEWNPPHLRVLVAVDSPLRLDERIILHVQRLGRNPSRPWASRELFVEKFRLLPSSGKARPEEIAHIARHSLKPLGNGTWLLKTDKTFHRNRTPTDLRPGWKNVTAPAMLMRGELSDRLSPRDISWLKSKRPDIEVLSIPGAHHHVYLDQPEAFRRAALGFLSRRLS